MREDSTTTPTDTTRLDRLIALFVFVGLSALYFATVGGITSSNDGSHYALLRTMIANRTFALEQFDDFAEGNDIALTPDGRLFSDRPPGTALAAIPFYLLGGPLPDPPAPFPSAAAPSRHDAGNPRLPYVLLLPVFAGAGAAALLYGLQRRLGIGRAAALTAVLFFALGTTHWKYSTVLYSHALSAFLVTLAVYPAIWLAGQARAGWGWHALLGFVLGAAVVVEYANALLVIVVGLFWLWRTWPVAARRPWATALPMVLGGLLPAAFLAWYNTVNFGGPLTLSYTYAVNYPWAGALATTFNFPLLAGLRALLWWGEGGGWCGGPPCVNQGLFLLSPVWLAALPGWLIFRRRQPAAFGLMSVLFLIYLLLFAKHHTSHGFTADGRYLMPFLGLLVPAMGFALDGLLSRVSRTQASSGKPGFYAPLALIVYGLFFLSLGNQARHIATSFNYTFDPAQWQLPLARPENWAVFLLSLFPNAANWPLLILPLMAIALVVALMLYTMRRRDSQKKRGT